jgi:hypothetical protein
MAVRFHVGVLLPCPTLAPTFWKPRPPCRNIGVDRSSLPDWLTP